MIDDPMTLLLLTAAFFAVATLYSSVGHAGASGYLATMALFGLAPAAMRPTALALNILVATLTTYRFARAGQFHLNALWPFLVGSVPMALVGGAWRLEQHTYYVLVGSVLLASAAILVWRARQSPLTETRDAVKIRVAPAIVIGAVIGLLSGLTGTGGGIFLSPVILLAGWAGPIATAGIAAPFIWANSVAALSAGTAVWADLPSGLPWLIVAVLLGGLLGTSLGLRKYSPSALLLALATVLAVAAIKLFATSCDTGTEYFGDRYVQTSTHNDCDGYQRRIAATRRHSSEA